MPVFNHFKSSSASSSLEQAANASAASPKKNGGGNKNRRCSAPPPPTMFSGGDAEDAKEARKNSSPGERKMDVTFHASDTVILALQRSLWLLEGR